MSSLCYSGMKPDSSDFKRQNQEFAGFTRRRKRHKDDSGKCHLLQGRMGNEISSPIYTTATLPTEQGKLLQYPSARKQPGDNSYCWNLSIS